MFIIKFFIFFLYLVLNQANADSNVDKLYIEDLIEGKGNIVTDKDNINLAVFYTGWLFDKNNIAENKCNKKGKLFDKSKREKDPFTFPLGKGKVIKGWENGFDGMRVGGIRCLVIPSNQAYGSREIGNIIPRNSSLIFEIELIEILQN